MGVLGHAKQAGSIPTPFLSGSNGTGPAEEGLHTLLAWRPRTACSLVLRLDRLVIDQALPSRWY